VDGGDGRPGADGVGGLLPRVAHGDAAAFAGVCDQVSGAVYGLVSRIVGDQSRAEQVAADVLTEVWRSASHFSPAQGSGINWIMTIARRRAMNHAGAERAGAESLLAHRGLAALPGPQREAVLLAWCGYTWRQVADLMGVPAGTAAGWLRDGLLELSNRPE
jgi:RNA polymerase sigma-70 factor (ECF subfamily)